MHLDSLEIVCLDEGYVNNQTFKTQFSTIMIACIMVKMLSQAKIVKLNESIAWIIMNTLYFKRNKLSHRKLK